MKKSLSDLTIAFKPNVTVSGEKVVRTFQPSCTQASDGTLFAFCQGRLREGGDDDPKAVLMATSTDAGATWSEARIVSPPLTHYAISAYTSTRDGRERVSCLTMVDLRTTEQFYARDYAAMKERTGIDIDEVGRQTPMVLCRFDSDDGGDTWTSHPLTGDDTPLGKRYNGATLIMFNPIGQAHRITEGPYRGRMIIAGPLTAVPEEEPLTDYFRNHAQSGSGVIYSEDQGATWHMDGMITDYLANEASAVSIHEGRELLIVRRINNKKRFAQRPPLTDFRPGPGERIAHTSPDCGATWSEPFAVPISDVICHGTLARMGDHLLFSIPNGAEQPPAKTNLHTDRTNGAIYFSTDEGATWRHKIVHPDTFSYSTVLPLSKDRAMVLFASGRMGDGGVGCRVFTKAWLEG